MPGAGDRTGPDVSHLPRHLRQHDNGHGVRRARQRTESRRHHVPYPAVVEAAQPPLQEQAGGLASRRPERHGT